MKLWNTKKFCFFLFITIYDVIKNSKISNYRERNKQGRGDKKARIIDAYKK